MSTRHTRLIGLIALTLLGSGCLNAPSSAQGAYEGTGVTTVDYLDPSVDNERFFDAKTYVAVAQNQRDEEELFMRWGFSDLSCTAEIEALSEERFNIPMSICQTESDQFEITLSYRGKVDVDENGGMTVTLGGDFQLRSMQTGEITTFAFDHSFDGERI